MTHSPSPSPPDSLPPMMNTMEVATLFRVAPLTVRKWARKGKIKSIKPGGRLLFPRDRVLALYHREGNHGSG